LEKKVAFFLMVLITAWCMVLPVSAAASDDYYPLRIGNTWTYRQVENGRRYEQKVTEKVQIDNKEAVVVETSIRGQKEYYTINPEGIYTLMRSFKTNSFRFEPLQYFIKYPVKIGDSWEQNGSLIDSSNKLSFTYRTQYYYTGVTKVVVPAGSFTAVKMLMEIQTSDGSHSTIVRYIAEGVGIVREERSIEFKDRKLKFTTVLLDYNLVK
jgi:hypothetical protein